MAAKKLNPGKVYEKFLGSDGLTNPEVELLVTYYKDLADRLFQCGPTFRLAAQEANRVYLRASDYKAARAEK